MVETWERFNRWSNSTGHPITYCILRICLPVLLWTCWGAKFQLFHVRSALSLAIGIAFYLATLAMFVGYKARISTAITACICVITYYGLGIYLTYPGFVFHHSYLLCVATILLAFSPCGEYLSFDSWHREAKQASSSVSLVPLYLMRLQISAMYLWTAIDKLNPLFTSGASLDFIFFRFYSHYPEIVSSPLLKTIYPSLAWVTISIEVFLAFGLWIPKTKKIALLVGVVLHLLFYFMLPVECFTGVMLVLYLCFLDPTDVYNFSENFVGFKSRP